MTFSARVSAKLSGTPVPWQDWITSPVRSL
jgi:hypothetical protein